MSNNSPKIKNSNVSNDSKDSALIASPEKIKDKHPDTDCEVKLLRRVESPLPDLPNLDCLQLADTSITCAPLHLCTVLVHFDSGQLTQAELLFLLIYIIALESGYTTENEYEKSRHFISHISSATAFHSKNVLRLSRVKPLYNVSEDRKRFSMGLISIIDYKPVTIEKLFSLMSACVSGDLMIVTLSPANCTGANGFSVALSIGRYVLSTQARDQPAYHRFRKLDELTTILRNDLFVPMRNKQLNWLQAHIYPSLDAMPAELYDHVLQYLNKNELNVLANVNRSLHNLTVRSKYMKKQQCCQSENPLSRSNSALYYLR